MKQMCLLFALFVAAVALIMGAAIPQALARGWTIEECEEGLDESEVFFEFNFTDCDLGIQFFWDGPPWRSMIVKDESGRSVLNVFPRRNVRAVGLAEGMFEGFEPQLIAPPEECDLEDARVQAFLQQYRLGEYNFIGMAAQERCLLLGDAELTYNFPTPPELDLAEFPLIEWEQPENGAETIGYTIVVEVVFLVPVIGEPEPDEQVFKETATFPGTQTQYTVSEEFLNLIENPPEGWEVDEKKVELLAEEESGNKIIVEEEVEQEE